MAIYASLVLPLAFANSNELKAQTPSPSPAAQGECTAENKLAWYTEFRAIYKTNQDKAYDLAQKYLACPGEAADESVRNYLKKSFVDKIDMARRTPRVSALVYDKKDYPKAFELGKQVLADEPDNVKVLMDLAWAGAASKNDAYSADSLAYGKKAIQLIEAGTAPDVWVPYANKEDALGYLNNAIGVLTLTKDPSGALPYLLKSAQFEGKLKKQAFVYGYIGDAYQNGPYDKLSADYKRLYEGKDETPESKLALENINQVIDRMIDAYARAVALSGTDAASAPSKKAWLETLTTWYKYRNKGSDAGLTDLIAGVMAKPLPPEPTPLTTLPAATPATSSTPGSTTTNAAGTTAAPGTGMATGPAKPAATPAAVTTTTKPATTTTDAAVVKPAKPKTRNNHRRQ